MNTLIRDHLAATYFAEYQLLRNELVDMLRDDDLAFRPSPATFTLGELCREIGEIEHSYVDALKTFRQEFGRRNADPEVGRSVATLSAWFADLDRGMLAAIEALTEDDVANSKDHPRRLRHRRLLAAPAAGARHLPGGPADLLRQGQHLPADDGQGSSRALEPMDRLNRIRPLPSRRVARMIEPHGCAAAPGGWSRGGSVAGQATAPRRRRRPRASADRSGGAPRVPRE